ncbi:unnamed protein product, partial [Onchocerca flexuosa]|uniref:AKAP7_NLS domain-containing protein n=1 Tax=Onchocerca flexuosa TaxID=387005 RepID=A0A183I0T8_9BILA
MTSTKYSRLEKSAVSVMQITTSKKFIAVRKWTIHLLQNSLLIGIAVKNDYNPMALKPHMRLMISSEHCTTKRDIVDSGQLVNEVILVTTVIITEYYAEKADDCITKLIECWRWHLVKTYNSIDGVVDAEITDASFKSEKSTA